MTLTSGTKLGRYEIRSMIGAGGMGEVYLANDPKIGRNVAIKVLPSGLSENKERLARFEQEAQAAGALNHPNILAIYDVDSENGTTYVVSELLEGETLRDALGGAAMQVRRALDYAQQVAQGMAAAHEKGIIHRDLKPENLFVTKDGRVKILDFGLAKLVETDDAGASSDLPTRRVNTDAGAIMGTAGYMSPEQLRGTSVDPRTDIFSFGSVLYEMLAGRKAFQRDSTADTISAILREDPPELSDTNSNVNPGLERVVRRCLEKNREQRFHSASDLAFALGSLTETQASDGATAIMTVESSGTADARNKWGQLGWILAATFLIAAGVIGWAYFRRADPPAETMRFAIVAPEKSGYGDSLAISPDGRRIALISVSDTGVTSLLVRVLDSLETKVLQGTEGASLPFWSPDSRFVGFFAGGKLKKIDAAGGNPQVLADASSDPRGGSWGKDGTILFSPTTTSPLFKVPATGGTATQVTELDNDQEQRSHRWPSFLPDGIHYLYFGRGGKSEAEGIYAGSLGSAEKQLIINTKIGGRYAPANGRDDTGSILYVRDGMLVSQPFDTEKLRLIGEPNPVAEGVLNFPSEGGPTAYASFSVSDNGRLVYKPGGKPLSQLHWMDRTGKTLENLAQPGLVAEPFISPDARKVVVGRDDDVSQDLWIYEFARNASTRFTFNAGADVSPVWSPDGTRIVFASNRSGTGKFEIYHKSSSGAGDEELLIATPFNAFPDHWSADGKYIIYELKTGPTTKTDLWIFPVAGGGAPFPFLQTPFEDTHAQFSPDGRWITYASDESGKAEVFVRGFAEGAGKWQISTEGGDQPQWSRDGRTLYYIAADRNLMAVPIGTANGGFDPGRPAILFQTNLPTRGLTDDRNNYLAAPDGQRFLVNNLVGDAHSEPITVVLNWNGDRSRE